MKRFAALFTVFALLLTLFGCAGAPDSADAPAREQAVKQIIYTIGSNSFKSVEPADLTSCPDFASLSEGCADYMATAVGGGYISLDKSGALGAGKTLSHAEAKAILAVDSRLGDASAALPDDGKPLTNEELTALLSAIDAALTDVREQDDFFLYANRVTLRNHYADETHKEWSQYGPTSFNVAAREAELLDAIMSGEASYGEDTPEYRIGKIIGLLNDSDKRANEGVAPLQPYFDKIDACGSIDEFVKASAEITMETGTSPFFWIRGSNDKETNVYYLYLTSMTFGLGGVTDDPEPYIDGYCALLFDMFAAAGLDADEALIRGMVELQNSTATEKPFDASYEYITYVMKLSDFDDVMTNMDVAGYLEVFGLEKDSIMIENYDYYRLLNSALTDENLPYFKLIAKQDLILGAAPYLTDEMASAAQNVSDCVNEVIKGADPASATKPKNAYSCQYDGLENAELILFMKNYFGLDIPQAYANAYVSDEMTRRLADMTDKLMAAFRKRLESNDWLSDSTRAAALDKLDNITVNLIKPELYKHPTSFDSLSGAFFSLQKNDLENQIRACNDVDVYKKHWRMTADEANACYMPENNSINIPAGIVMWPFASDDMSEAEIYGAIGAVIGHELTHGFDKQGSQYDKDGRLINWWTDADHEVFTEKQEAIKAYYGEWPYRDDVVQDPNVTILETVADLGGLGLVMDILAGDADAQATAMRQFAYVWADVATAAQLDSDVAVDVHPIKRVRVNAALATLPEFYECFGVKEGDGMYVAPEDRVALW